MFSSYSRSSGSGKAGVCKVRVLEERGEGALAVRGPANVGDEPKRHLLEGRSGVRTAVD